MKYFVSYTPFNYTNKLFFMIKPFSANLQLFFVSLSPITKKHMTLKTHVILLTFSLRKWWRRKTSTLQ